MKGKIDSIIYSIQKGCLERICKSQEMSQDDKIHCLSEVISALDGNDNLYADYFEPLFFLLRYTGNIQFKEYVIETLKTKAFQQIAVLQNQKTENINILKEVIL